MRGRHVHLAGMLVNVAGVQLLVPLLQQELLVPKLTPKRSLLVQ